MSDDPKKNDWYKEFQRANQAPAPPGRRDVKREHTRFELDGANTIVFEHGMLTLLGLKRTLKAIVTLDLSSGGVGVIVKRRLMPRTKVSVKITSVWPRSSFAKRRRSGGLAHFVKELGVNMAELPKFPVHLKFFYITLSIL